MGAATALPPSDLPIRILPDLIDSETRQTAIAQGCIFPASNLCIFFSGYLKNGHGLDIFMQLQGDKCAPSACQMTVGAQAELCQIPP